MTLARRDFLRAAAVAPLAARAGALGTQRGAGAPGTQRGTAKSCILLVLAGGPSQLDTWDMKPDAPREIRGPFRPVRTNVPGIMISEIFPRVAKHADKYALIRSVYGATAPVHEDALRAIDAAAAGFIELSGPLGFMGGRAAPAAPAPAPRSFAENCRLARLLVEKQPALVRINMFPSVFHRATWDSHGARPFSTILDYRDTVAPAFDFACAALLEDLSSSGLLSTTLVVAMGEFGRSPRINPAGGRDHWTKCQTVLMAGGGIRGGRIYGSSGPDGAEPKDNPVSVASILATLHEALGLRTGGEPVRELFV